MNLSRGQRVAFSAALVLTAALAALVAAPATVYVCGLIVSSGLL